MQRRIDELESIQVARVNEIAKATQEQYETQLVEAQEKIADLEQMQSIEDHDRTLKAQYESQITQLQRRIDELESIQVARVNEIAKATQEHYESQIQELRTRNEELETTQQEKLEATTLAIREQYQSLLQEVTNNPEVLEAANQSVTARVAEVAEPSSLPTNPSVSPQPSNPQLSLQAISQQVTNWGNSQQLKHLYSLAKYARANNAEIRKEVAIACGKIAAAHSKRPETERIIPTLGKLSQDAKPAVRLVAVEALGMIQSKKTLPFLKRALQDSTNSVRQVASVALKRLHDFELVKSKPISVQKKQR